MSDAETDVVLFDGVCNLCNQSVQFILDRDPSSRIRFAPLQSVAGQRLLDEHGLPSDTLGSMVFIDRHNVASRHSSAALRVAKRLKQPWPLLSVGLLVPKVIRDAVYRWIAANRYRWFGRSESCRLLTPELRGRFLEGSDLWESTSATEATASSI